MDEGIVLYVVVEGGKLCKLVMPTDSKSVSVIIDSAYETCSMESGVVRDGQDLIPYLFQFLVLLAY